MALIEGIGAAAAIINTLRNAAEIAKNIRNENDIEAVRASAGALLDMLLDVRIKAVGLHEQVVTLSDALVASERKVREYEDFSSEAERFQRVAVWKSFVYREKKPPNEGAGVPNFCPNCFFKKQLTLLPHHNVGGEAACPACSGVFAIAEPRRQGPPTVRTFP